MKRVKRPRPTEGTNDWVLKPRKLVFEGENEVDNKRSYYVIKNLIVNDLFSV